MSFSMSSCAFAKLHVQAMCQCPCDCSVSLAPRKEASCKAGNCWMLWGHKEVWPVVYDRLPRTCPPWSLQLVVVIARAHAMIPDYAARINSAATTAQSGRA